MPLETEVRLALGLPHLLVQGRPETRWLQTVLDPEMAKVQVWQLS